MARTAEAMSPSTHEYEKTKSARSGDSSGAGVAGDEGTAGSTRSEHSSYIIIYMGEVEFPRF